MWFDFAPGKSRRHGARPPGDDGEARDHSGAGLSIFLASMGVLLGVAIMGYGAVRQESETWGSIWTWQGAALMGGATLALILARESYRHAARYAAQERDVRPWMVLGVFGFLLYGGAQTLHWRLLEPGLEQGLRNEVITFTLITGLHSVMCLGGSLATGCMAWRFMVSGPGACVRGLGLLRRYWTFLLWTWVLLLVMLVV